MLSSTPTGAVTAEGKATPVSKVVINNVQLVPSKVTALIVCTDELLTRVDAAGQALFSRELLGAISDAVDAAFVSTIATGVTPITSTGPMPDLRAALAAVNFVGQARPYWLAHPATAGLMSTLTATKGGPGTSAASVVGGELANLPLLTSTGVPTGSLYLIDGSGLAVNAETPTVDVSQEADIEMSTTPASASDTPTAAQMVSMFTTNSTALLATAWVAFQRLRTNAVAVVTGITATTWAP
jgi:HK97 family phage major capsid protein